MIGAVYFTGLDKLMRHALQKLLDDEHSKRRGDRGNGQTDERVRQAKIKDEPIKRNDVYDHGQHHAGKDDGKNHVASGKAEAGQLVSRQR